MTLGPVLRAVVLAACVLLAAPPAGAVPALAPAHPGATPRAAATNGSVLGNFSAVVNRIVVLIGAAGGGLLAVVWARVALSWFSHDVTKKVQAKDRARDAMIGTLIFAAALSGLIWGLAQWVLTGG